MNQVKFDSHLKKKKLYIFQLILTQVILIDSRV